MQSDTTLWHTASPGNIQSFLIYKKQIPFAGLQDHESLDFTQAILICAYTSIDAHRYRISDDDL